ncbi:unnamed protein product [Lactuca virosa]|uniref:Uncharacterized protein n=1 Tax=Lactuca virosa TaxID=75947 RepID=A0AAU9MUH5_9ASTR|nr:unnamed protein product [Lactuca virosa]
MVVVVTDDGDKEWSMFLSLYIHKDVHYHDPTNSRGEIKRKIFAWKDMFELKATWNEVANTFSLASVQPIC